MRFAGTCFVDVSSLGIYIEDIHVIGEHPHTPDDLDSYNLSLENDDEIKKLQQGQYHIFFYGEYDWECHDHWEFGPEYEIEITEWIITTFQLKEGENNENN